MPTEPPPLHCPNKKGNRNRQKQSTEGDGGTKKLLQQKHMHYCITPHNPFHQSPSSSKQSEAIRKSKLSLTTHICKLLTEQGTQKMPEILNFFSEKEIPHQKSFGGVAFPVVLSPSGLLPDTASNLDGAIKEQRPWLESLLHKHGAILFRGLSSLATAADFNDVVEAFGFEELPYVGGAAPRNIVYGRVYTTNESPPDKKIHFHHEMAQVSKTPSKLFFFCEEEPAQGGETPIVLSHVVYERMNKKYPEFVKNLEKYGLKYVRIISEEDDNSSAIGRGWKSTFLTDDKRVAEEKAAKVNTKIEWADNGDAITIMGPIPAIRYDEKRQRKIWFNSMVSARTTWDDKRNDPTKAVTFGDGSPLPSDVIFDCLKIMEEESVAIPWQKGDVLLIDNLAALHSRKSFTAPRRILASLCV